MHGQRQIPAALGRLLILATVAALASTSGRGLPAQELSQKPPPKGTPAGAQVPPPAEVPPLTPLPASSTSITVFGNPDDVPEELIHAEAEREVKAEETQRIAGIVPNFNTVLSGEGVRLAPKQKLDLTFHTMTDPFNIIGAFVFGGISEIQGTHRNFGWGPAGYGKRVGANLADVVDGTMFSGFVYPVLFHQDPRYFRQATGSVGSRTVHALSWALVGRGDNGRREPNYSNILGNLSAGAISNLYYPDTGIKLTLVNSVIVTAEGALGNIGLEFAPDVQARFKRYWNKRTAPHPAVPGLVDPDLP
jgi:hypothetical protein